MFVPLGIFFGSPYALMTGLLYAFLPPRFQHPLVGAVLGFASTTALQWREAPALISGGDEINWLIGAIGGLAGWVSAHVVKKLDFPPPGADRRAD